MFQKIKLIFSTVKAKNFYNTIISYIVLLINTNIKSNPKLFQPLIYAEGELLIAALIHVGEGF